MTVTYFTYSLTQLWQLNPDIAKCPLEVTSSWIGNLRMITPESEERKFPVSYFPFFFAFQWSWGCVWFLLKYTVEDSLWDLEKKEKSGEERAKQAFSLSILSFFFFFKWCGQSPHLASRLLSDHHFRDLEVRKHVFQGIQLLLRKSSYEKRRRGYWFGVRN